MLAPMAQQYNLKSDMVILPQLHVFYIQTFIVKPVLLLQLQGFFYKECH